MFRYTRGFDLNVRRPWVPVSWMLNCLGLLNIVGLWPVLFSTSVNDAFD